MIVTQTCCSYIAICTHIHVYISAASSIFFSSRSRSRFKIFSSEAVNVRAIQTQHKHQITESFHMTTLFSCMPYRCTNVQCCDDTTCGLPATGLSNCINLFQSLSCSSHVDCEGLAQLNSQHQAACQARASS